ncbi:MAG: efflux RND transporter periplasmic adaptor subunit [Wenzhouxiangellaceae bacterium]
MKIAYLQRVLLRLPVRAAVLLIVVTGLTMPPVQAQPAAAVTVQPLSELLVERELRAPAQVMAANDAALASEVEGVITAVHADVGQLVQQGDVLVSLDPGDYELNLMQADSNLAANAARITQAEMRLQRARDLSGNQYVSADDLLARETELAILRAERRGLEVAQARAREELARCTIAAPFSGVVSERQAQVGAFTARGGALLTLVQSTQREVDAEVPAHLAATLPRADQLLFLTNNDRWPLRLARLSPVIEPASRSQRARLVFAGREAPIGASGELSWILAGGLLPAHLVVSRDGRLGVFIADGGTAVFHSLPQAQEGRPVALDWAGDTPIVVAGRDRLQDGDRITVSVE